MSTETTTTIPKPSAPAKRSRGRPRKTAEEKARVTKKPKTDSTHETNTVQKPTVDDLVEVINNDTWSEKHNQVLNFLKRLRYNSNKSSERTKRLIRSKKNSLERLKRRESTLHQDLQSLTGESKSGSVGDVA